MGRLNYSHLEVAQGLAQQIRARDELSENDIRNALAGMGFELTDENELQLFMAFSLGIMTQEPEDSEWVKDINLVKPLEIQ